MRTPQPGPDHQDALTRRLALLGDELAWLRPEPAEPAPPGAPRPGAAGEREPGPGATGPSPPRPWWDEHTRVSDRRLSAVATPPTGAGPQHAATRALSPAAVGARPGAAAQPPQPGRHAARPARHDVAELTDPASTSVAELAGRARLLLGPAQLTVVTVLLVLALAVTCWWLARGRPDSTVALQAAPAAGLTAAASVGASSAPGSAGVAAQTEAVDALAATPATAGPGAPNVGATGAAASTVTVDVSGRVRHPGVQVLATGARIADALAAAGGAKSGVDLTALNLAQVLVDGQQILVGVAADSGSSSVSGGVDTATSGSSTGTTSSTTTDAVEVVDLNTATADQLDTLPDVGPVTAQSILAWRDANGGFTSVDELLEVDGIGEVTLGKLAPYVTV